MITRRIAGVLLLSSIFFGAEAAFAGAESEAGKTISVLLINDATAAIALDDPGPSADCGLFTFIVFDPDTALGKNLYAAVLMAKAVGGPVTVWYDQNGTDCTLTQILF